MAKLFVYGEPLRRESLLELIGRVPNSKPAVLHGFRKELDGDSGFYVIVPDPEATVECLLLEGLREVELRALDEYEEISSGLYRREPVRVEIPEGTIKAYVYWR